MKRSILLLLVPALGLAAEPVRFREHVIATDLAGGYQVTPTDVNRDGKTDLIALASGMTELLWFEAPNWERHVLATGVSRPINLTKCGDVIVFAQHFQNQAAKSVGDVVVLERPGDIRQPWSKREIDRIPTSHRLRCADIDGSGNKVVINAPLTGVNAEPPGYRDRVPLVYYKPGEWKRRVVGSENEGVMHGIYIHDWTGDGRDDILTASFSGIHVYSLPKERYWKRTEIAKGDPSPWPKSGSSDIAVGHVGNDRFVASIEPWHGHQLAVYRHGERSVIDDTLNDGHTVVTADLNGDGSDEIIAGFRREPRSVYLYYAERGSWRRETLDDGGIAAAACAAADLNADGRIDITCIGSATRNLKWYENLGR